MDATLILVPLEPFHLHTFEEWFEDRELRRRLGGMLPLRQFLEFVWAEPTCMPLLAMESGQPVGAVIVQIEPKEPATFSFLVAPELRFSGYGRRILNTLLHYEGLNSPLGWSVQVEANNLACGRCLTSVGFGLRSSQPDVDGFLDYDLRP